MNSYPWYLSDWRGSETAMTMTAEQRGIYRELLDHCWDKGSLPVEEDALKRIVRATDREWKRSWPVVRKQFYELDGRLHNAKVDERRQAVLDVKADRQRGAMAANEARRAKQSANAERHADCHTEDAPRATLSATPSTTPSERLNIINTNNTPPPFIEKSAECSTVVDIPDLWRKFLSKYPNHTGLDSAYRWFISELSKSKDPLSLFRDMEAGLERWLASVRWRDRETGELQVEFIPDLTRFLGVPNGRDSTRGPMWLDHPPAWHPPRRKGTVLLGDAGEWKLNHEAIDQAKRVRDDPAVDEEDRRLAEEILAAAGTIL